MCAAPLYALCCAAGAEDRFCSTNVARDERYFLECSCRNGWDVRPVRNICGRPAAPVAIRAVRRIALVLVRKYSARVPVERSIIERCVDRFLEEREQIRASTARTFANPAA